MLLANHFAARMAQELGKLGPDEVPEFTNEATLALERHPWPGNIRELRNVVERAVYRSDSAVVSDVVFDPFVSPYALRAPGPGDDVHLGGPAAPAPPGRALKDAVAELQVRMIRDALECSRHNQRKAASKLGLTYHEFRGLYRKHRRRIDRGRSAAPGAPTEARGE
jgi:psp operon transcriptional activator